MALTTLTVPTVGAVTVDSATPGYPSSVVGSPPQWADNSDASYTHLQGVYQDTTAIAGSGTASLQVPVAGARVVAGATAKARIRVSSPEGKPLPSVRIKRANGAVLLYSVPAGVTPAAATWVDIPLYDSDGGLAHVLYVLKNNTETLAVTVETPLSGFTFPYSIDNLEWTVYEVELVIELPGTDAPPCRLFPRADGLGVGSGRHFPPPKSQQRSGRRFGYY